VLAGFESRSGSDEVAAPLGDIRLGRYRKRWIEMLREGACAE
jgi:hypothetical protein